MDGQQEGRAEGQPLELLDAGIDPLDPEASVGLGLIVRDLARALGAALALLAIPDETREHVEVLASWGAVASHGGLPTRLAADGFVGRALTFERAAVEPTDCGDSLGAPKSAAKVTHALGAPVIPLVSPPGVLLAGFSSEPTHDSTTTLWLAESYARLASLCIHDRGALDGLLSGGRLDGLTGCLTQTAFLQELRREVARCERHARPLSCSFIDLDNFKRVNDRYGHLHGSRVLANIATVVRAAIRREDTLGRYGGDEFVVLLPDTDEAAALELSERLRSTIARTMINLPHDPIDASIGVAQWRPGSPVNALLSAADEALLAAKATGGCTAIAASALIAPTAPAEPPIAPAHPSTAGSPEPVSVNDVLDVSEHFEKAGGASIELTAWELDTDLARVTSAWSRAIQAGLLEPAGTDEESGEEMWRLTASGRHALHDEPLGGASPGQ